MNRRSVRLSFDTLETRVTPSLLGTTLFPDNSPFNQVVASAPKATDSDAIIRYLKAQTNGQHQGLFPDVEADAHLGDQNFDAAYGIPYNVVHGNDPTTVWADIPITSYASESDLTPGTTSLRVPLPAHIRRETGVKPPGDPTLTGLDHHVLIYDIDNQIGYEFYGFSFANETALGVDLAKSAAVWDYRTNDYRTIGYTSTDAAGLPVLPLLVRPDEAMPVEMGGQGKIDHAMRFTLATGYIRDSLYAYPASHPTIGGFSNALPYMGMRLRLKSSINIDSLPGASKIIAQALKDYGMILADRGGNFMISAASASVNANNEKFLTWGSAGDPEPNIYDLFEGLLSRLDLSNFEVVDLKPRVTSISSVQGSAGDWVTIAGSNFSGAGGRIEVLFGSAQSPNVTVLNDKTIVAQVPYGSGIVSVRVQSGISISSANTADTKGLKDPKVWGYGVSTGALGFAYRSASKAPIGSPVGFATVDGWHSFVACGDGQIMEMFTPNQGEASFGSIQLVSGTVPTPASNLSATVRAINGVDTYFLDYCDAQGRIRALSRASTATKWTLTDVTAANVAVGDPLVSNDAAGRHVIFRTADNQIREVLIPDAGQSVASVLFVPGSGPPFLDSDPVGVTVPSISGVVGETDLHVLFRDDTGAIRHLMRVANGVWQAESLIAVQGGDDTAIGSLSVAAEGSDVLVAFRNQGDHVRLLKWTSATSTWSMLTLPAAFDALSLRPASEVKLYAKGGDRRILYFDAKGSPIQLGYSAITGLWTQSPLTPISGLSATRGAGVPQWRRGVDGAEYVTFVDAVSRQCIEICTDSNSFRTFAVVGTDAPSLLATPAAKGPVDLVESDSQSFAWNAVPNAVRYDLRLVYAPNGRLLVWKPGLTATSFTATSLRPGLQYAWQVRAVAANGVVSPWTGLVRFAVEPLTAPGAIGPSGESVGDDSPLFSWSNATNAVQYDLLLVDASIGRAILGKVGLTATSWQAPALTPGHSFLWYLRSRSASGTISAWSAAKAFSILKLGVPTSPSIGNPLSDTPKFSWSAVDNAARYAVYIADAATGAGIVRWTDPQTTTLSGISLTPGRSYRWRVGSVSANNTFSGWGMSQTFSVSALIAPAILSPLTSAAAGPMTFTWSPVANAATYIVSLVDLTAGGTQTVRVPQATSWQSPSLKAGHRYRWYVRAVSTNGTLSPLSSIATFDVTA